MFNKKRIIAVVVVLLLSFFMMSYGEPAANTPISLRDVTFIDSYDNKDLGTKQVELGGKVETPDVPEHRDVVFREWCYEGTENPADLSSVMENMTVETCYDPDINNNDVPDQNDPRYTVTFVNSRTEGVLKTQSVLVGMNATAPGVPTYDGFTFNGWTNPYTNVRRDITTRTIYNERELEVEKFTVTFVDGDTGLDITKVEVEKGASASTPVPPKHEKRVFDYWLGNYSNVTKNETVTAVYTDDRNENEIKDYEEYIHVRYDLNGGVSTTPIVDNNDYLADFDDVTLTKLVPTKTDAKFMGWSLTKHAILTSVEEEEKVVFVKNTFKISGDTTIYAVWAEDDNENEIEDYKEYYKVEYVSSCSTTKTIAKVLYKSKIEDLVKTFNNGWTITGWYKEANLINKWDFNTDRVLKDTTVYGKCEEIKYNVTFDLNDANVIKAGHSNKITSYKITDETYILLDATSESHNFDGWFIGTTKYLDIEKGSTGDKDFVAHWTIKNYDVTFCKTDQTCERVDVDHGDDVTTPDEEEKEGYTCVWDPNVSLTDVKSDLTVNSICTKNKYSLTVNPNGGVYEGKTTNTVYTDVEYESTKTINYPTREGYTLIAMILTGKGSKLIDNTFTMGNADATLIAKWSINSYTITFDTKGGSEVAPITEYYGTNVTAPKNPTKEGYTFAGWDVEIPATMPAKDMTITASWTINSYTITFDTKGGSEIAPITQNYGTNVTKPTNPTKEGYTFAGWDIEVPATMPAKDMTITASWTVNSYTITFDTKGGSTIAPITQNYGTDVTKPADPTKEGYTFAGWDKLVPAKMPAKNMTITASWTEDDYKITYDLNNTNVIDATHPNKKTTYKITDATYTLLDAVSESHNFDGWFIGTTEYTELVKGSTGDKTFVAHWTIKNYDVTFCKTDQTCEIIDVDHGDDITAPDEEEKEGYTCVWDPSVSLTDVTSDLTVNSICTKNKYNVTVNPNGGLYDSKTTNTVYTEVEYESTKTINNPEREGYSFVNWTLTGKGSTLNGTTFTMGSDDATLVANWTINRYTITFDTKGGSTIAPITGNYNTDVTAPKNPTKEGYTFAGWDIAIPAKMPAKNMTITASWTINSYTITFDTKGGNTIAPITQNFGTNVTAPADPTKTGYTFAGWDVEVPTKMPAKNMTITASWTINSYTLTVNPNGGLYDSKTTNTIYTAVKYEETKTIADATRIGYTFDGWTLTGLNSTLVNKLFTMGSDDATLKANWKVNTYKINYHLNNNALVDGKVNNTKTTYTVEDPTYTLIAASSTSHNFDGWYLADGTTLVTAINKGTTGDIDVYAHWTIKTNTVTYKDGTTTVEEIPVDYGEDVTDIPEVPEHPGYTCVWDPATVTNVTGPVTVNTDCKIIDYTVTYVLNDTGVTNATHENTLTSYTVVTPEYTLTDAESLSHTFAGWYTLATGGDKVTTLAGGKIGNVTLYAHWVANQYQVDFESNGGSEVNPITGVLYNQTITKPIDPTKNGYDFNGWFKETTLANNWNFMTDTVKSSLTLYAKWVETIYDLTFVMNADGVTNAVTPTNESTYTISSEFAFNNATSESHDFAGWYTAVTGGTKTLGITAGTTGDKTFYGNWNIKHYTVTFIDTNENELEKDVTWGSELTDVPTVTPVTGYDCTWDRTDYTNIKSDLTVNATCELHTYTLTVDANGGTWTGTTPQNIKYTKTTTINEPSKKGYTFTGWTLVGAGSKLEGTTFTMGYENATLTANYTINKFDLVVNPNGGVYNSTTANTTYEDILYASTKTIVDPTMTGYDFAGWTLTGTDATIDKGVFTMGTSDAMLKATWTPATNTKYVVEHYKQLLDGTFDVTPDDIDNLTGTTGEMTNATAKNYEGFTAGAITNALIAANGSTIITIKYTRNTFTLTLVAGEKVTSVTGAGSYKFGENVTIDAVLNSADGWNYSFSKWSSSNTDLMADNTTKNLTFTMPAGNLTLTASATRSEVLPNIEIGELTSNYPLSDKEAEPGTVIQYNVTINNKDSYNVPINIDLTSQGTIPKSYNITYISSTGVETTETVTSLDNITIPKNGSVKIEFNSKVADSHAINTKFTTTATIKTVNNTKIDTKSKSNQIEKSANVVTENGKDKNVLLILDLSGSMDDRVNGTKKITTLISATKTFVNKLKTDATKTGNKVSLNVIAIGNRQSEMNNGPRDKMADQTYAYMIGTYDLDSWISNTKIEGLKASGGTNITGALKIAQNILSDSNYRSTYKLKYYTSDADAYTVLLTDGANGPSGNIRISGTEDQVKYVRENSNLFAIGFGAGASNTNSDGYKDLLAITGNASLIYKANSATDLDNAFQSIAIKIGEQQSVTGKITVNLPISGLYYPILFSYMNGTTKTEIFTLTYKTDLLLHPDVTISGNVLTWDVSGTTYSNKLGLRVELDTSTSATNGE